MAPVEGWPKLQYDQLLAEGIRPFDERQEWTATPWSNNYLHSDHEMRTIVPGLFVAGVVRNVDPGIYFGGWSICKTAAFGRWAGESAGTYAQNIAPPANIDDRQTRKLKKEIFASLGKKGIEPERVLIQFQSIIFPVLVLKNESNLRQALQKVEALREDLFPTMGASDLHQLTKSNGVRSMALVADLVLRASLMRTESRASHYREDYPERDDRNWLGWIMVSQNEGKVSYRLEPVPLDKYKHRNWSNYSSNFRFPR